MSSEGTTDNRRTTNSTHTNTTNKNRDKRFLASLQSALGGESSRRHEIRPKNLETEEESTLTFSNALQKISLSNEGIADSVADVQPFLVQSANQFSEDEFNQLANVLFQSALEQTNIYFILEICSDLIAYPNFQSAFSDCLKDGVGKFLNGEKEQYENIPKIFAQLLSNKWQRKFNRATECSNFILFTVFNTIIGWINFVNTSCKDKEEIHSQKGDDENPQIFMRCIEGLLSFCNTGQRYLWMNYPELYDDIYNTVVELLVSNAILSRSVKASLLSLCQQMTKWSQANRPKYSNVATQTISRNY